MRCFKPWLLIPIFFFAFEAAGQSVTDATADDGGDNIRVLVRLERSDISSNIDLYSFGENSSSESGAPEVYVPVRGGVGSTDNNSYSYYGSSTNGDAIVTVDGTTDNNATLVFSVNTSGVSSGEYLYYAIKDDDGDYIATQVGVAPTVMLVGDSANVLVRVPFNDFCNSFTCGNLDDGAATTIEESAEMAIFISTLSSLGGTTVATTSMGTAAFYKVSFSNRISTSSSVDLDSLEKGDSRLVANYNSASLGIADRLFALLSTVSGDCTGGSTSTTETLGSVAASPTLLSSLTDLESTAESGSVQLKNLTNNQCYSVRLLFCDNYGFCSRLSQEIQERPEVIEALLNEQACFFLTAGFGGGHWLIRYFQKFRDQVLRNSAAGRLFIKFYYHVGPKYAPWLLDKPLLQKSVRGSAYMLYLFVHYFYLWLIFVALIVASFLLFFYRYQRFQHQHGDHLDF